MRPCLEASCHALTEHTRCNFHEREHEKQRGGSTARGLGYGYQRNREVVLERDGRRCYFPGCVTEATTADHIVPRARGGGFEVANLRSSCVRHNVGRRASDQPASIIA